MHYDELIRAQASAAEIACGRMTPRSLTALRESVEAACRLPANAGWERKAAAHAAFLTVLADPTHRRHSHASPLPPRTVSPRRTASVAAQAAPFAPTA